MNSEVPPHAHKEKGSFWWKDIFRLIPLFRAFTKVIIHLGETTLFWKDLWNDNLLEEEFNTLFTFAKNEGISVQAFNNSSELDQLFHLPLSQQDMHQWRNLGQLDDQH